MPPLPHANGPPTRKRVGNIKQTRVPPNDYLVLQLQKSISRVLLRVKYPFSINGDETPVCVEDVPGAIVNSVGARRVCLRAAGSEKTCFTSCIIIGI